MGWVHNKILEQNVFIIAEAGVNHNGKLSLAKKLALKAKKSGADAVKFQTWNTDEIILPGTKSLKYQKKNINKNQYDLAKSLELSYVQFVELKKYCKKIKILFLSTPDDIKSAKFLNNMQPFFKVGSSEINNFHLLNTILKFKKPILLSTGLSNIKEITNTIEFLKKKKFPIKQKLILMHCNSAYPTHKKDINLSAINTLRRKFNLSMGFSDHSEGIDSSVWSVFFDVRVIEKHLTLNKKMEGPDHSSSLNPSEFKEMVKKIREAKIAKGNGNKIISTSAKQNRKLMMRSIFANKRILKGELFTKKNITTKRPSGGLSPQYFFKLIGKKSKNNYLFNQRIKNLEIQ